MKFLWHDNCPIHIRGRCAPKRCNAIQLVLKNTEVEQLTMLHFCWGGVFNSIIWSLKGCGFRWGCIRLQSTVSVLYILTTIKGTLHITSQPYFGVQATALWQQKLKNRSFTQVVLLQRYIVVSHYRWTDLTSAAMYSLVRDKKLAYLVHRTFSKDSRGIC